MLKILLTDFSNEVHFMVKFEWKFREMVINSETKLSIIYRVMPR